MDLVLSQDGKLVAFFKEKPSGEFLKIANLSNSLVVDKSSENITKLKTATLEKVFSASSDVSIWKIFTYDGSDGLDMLDPKMFYFNDEPGRIILALKILKENHRNIRFSNITLPELFNYYGI